MDIEKIADGLLEWLILQGFVSALLNEENKTRLRQAIKSEIKKAKEQGYVEGFKCAREMQASEKDGCIMSANPSE